jgi:hypothetical protein
MIVIAGTICLRAEHLACGVQAWASPGKFLKKMGPQQTTSFQKRIEPLLPAIPMLFLLFIFLAADLYPCCSPERFGLTWQECRLAADTFTDIPNDQQVQRCFGNPAPSLEPGEGQASAQEAPRPFLVSLAQPYQLDSRLVSIGKLGVKYFLVVDGRRVGPVFDDIVIDDSSASAPFSVDYGQGRYVFRGVRHGAYYLVEISSNATLSSQ